MSRRFGAIDFASRRGFLRAMGAGMTAAPFIPLLQAQAATAPQRLVIMTGANGVGDLNKFFPTGSGTTFTMQGTTASLQPYQKDLIVFSELAGRYMSDEAGVHPMACANLLTATAATRPSGGTIYERQDATRATGISVDQYIAKAIGKDTPFESLQIGCGSEPTWAGDHIGDSICYRGPSDPIVAEIDYFKTFDRLFGSAAMAMGGGPDLRAGDDKSILDAVVADLNWVKGRVGAEDVRRLDAHLESIRDLENRVKRSTMTGGSTGSASCKAPMMPPRDQKLVFSPGFPGKFLPQMMKTAVDLTVAALACDLTRVVVIQVAASTALFSPTFMGLKDLLHNISHNNYTGMTAYTKYTIDNGFAYLLQQMKATPDVTGNLLDNTAVVWTNEFGDGGRHSASPIPVILAGKAGGKWQTGRYIKFGRKRRHVDLLVSLCRTFGLNDTKFGTDPTEGPIAELGV